MSKFDDLMVALSDKLSGQVAPGDIERVLDALVEVAGSELRTKGIFMIPRLARFQTVRKPATRERRGINPFTREEMVFPGRPASLRVKARPEAALTKALSPDASAPDDDEDDE